MSTDRLQRWALVAEILGGAVVFLTLIILILQIRGYTKALRGQELGDLRQMNMDAVATNLEHSAVYVKALRKPEELTPEEVYQFNLLLSTRVRTLYRFYEAYEVGLIEEEDWEKQTQIVPIYLGSAAARVVWAQLRDDYFSVPEFVKEVDHALETSPILPDDAYLDQMIQRVEETFKAESAIEPVSK